MSKQFIPYGPVLLIEPIKQSNILPSGLVKPDEAVEKPTTGKIRQVGTAPDFKVGQVVVFRQYAGVEWDFDGEKLLILPTEQVLGFER